MRLIDDKVLLDAMNEFGKDIIATLAKLLIQADKSATGKLVRSLDFKVKKVVDNLTILIESEDYLKYVDQGRKPGSFPPVKKIAEWCKVRGIDESAAWPISYKIFKFGIKPTNVIQDTVKKLQSDLMIKKLDNAYADWVDNALDDIFINASKKGNIVVRR